MEYRIGRRVPEDEPSPAQYRRRMLRHLAEQTPAPGLIAYNKDGEPVGWVAVGPREAFPRLQRSPVMRPVDDVAAWAAPCFVVPSAHRGRGIATALVCYAVEHARAAGSEVIEGFPSDRPGRSQPQWPWHGTVSMFRYVGFAEVARRKPERPIMRLTLRSPTLIVSHRVV